MLSLEQAQKETNDWLDFIKFKNTKREKKENEIEKIVNHFQDGSLRTDSDGCLVVVLNYPIKPDALKPGVEVVERNELKIKQRVNVEELRKHTANIDTQNPLEMIFAYMCAITGISRNLVSKLDLATDYKTLSDVAVFFM